MAQARSPTAECPICNEEVFSMKILPCKHEFCLTCLVQVSDLGEHGIKCPSCRKSHNLMPEEIGALPTLYYGQFQCTVCREPEDVTKSFWCSECAHLMCPMCTIEHHNSTPGHTTSKWSTLQAVKDCASQSLKMSALKPDTTPGENEKNVIKEFCNSLENQLLSQLEMMKQRSSESTEIPFHEKLTDLFGELDLSGISPMPTSIPLDRLQRVAGQILGVTNGGQMSADQTTNYFQPLKQKVLKCFQVQPKELASSLLNSANMEEIEVNKHQTPFAHPLEELQNTSVNLTFNQLGNPVCTDTFLSSLPDHHLFPAETPNFLWWVYEGNGTQLPRLLSIIDRNLQFSRRLCLLPKNQFIPLKITQDTNISRLQIEAGDTPLTEQSALNFSQCIISLINKALQLEWIVVFGKGVPVNWMKEVWNHLPSSLLGIKLHKLPLTTSEVNVIAGKYSNEQTGDIFLGYCITSWGSLLQLLTKIVQTRDEKEILIVTLEDDMNDADIFEKFLQGALQFKGPLELHFYEFELTEAHFIKLESCLKMLGILFYNSHEITFDDMICEQRILEKLKEICDQKRIQFREI